LPDPVDTADIAGPAVPTPCRRRADAPLRHYCPAEAVIDHD